MGNGIETLISRHSMEETVARLEAALRAKGVKLFAVVDHAGEAQAAGLAMRPTKVLIFGNPKAGTPVMLAAPSTALDLPLRILVAEGVDGQVTLAWNDPAWLQQRHGIPTELLGNLGAAGVLARAAAGVEPIG